MLGLQPRVRVLFAMRIARLALAAMFSALAGPASALDCAAPPVPDRIAAIPARGEALLESGVSVRLAGVRLADAGPVGVAARAAMDALAGAEVAGARLAPEPDRWGRRAATLAVARGEGTAAVDLQGDLAAALVSEGLAMVDVGPAETLCRPGLLDLEEGARRARRGVWADPAEAPVSAGDLDALEARRGRFTLVEGVVARVGVRDRTTYLDFSGWWSRGFTAVVPGEVWARLEARGLDAEALEGRRMRVRGIIEVRQGPAVTVTAVETIEILSSNSAEPRRSRP
jgi:endonuclease YncB( thermonuclease family)